MPLTPTFAPSRGTPLVLLTTVIVPVPSFTRYAPTPSTPTEFVTSPAMRTCLLVKREGSSSTSLIGVTPLQPASVTKPSAASARKESARGRAATGFEDGFMEPPGRRRRELRRAYSRQRAPASLRPW